jgi:hypothetical protein
MTYIEKDDPTEAPESGDKQPSPPHRFEFRIKDFDSGRVGPDGKSSTGTGWRYGVPHNDRKRDAVKIPTQVPEAN